MPVLYTSHSMIPNAGIGLFTKDAVKKGDIIIEYTGNITHWDAVKNSASNNYLYFVNENYVIDARHHPRSLGRYANDANGLIKVKGLENNSVFTNIDGRVFIKATKNIPAGSEIFVEYGSAYWETISRNEERRSQRK